MSLASAVRNVREAELFVAAGMSRSSIKAVARELNSQEAVNVLVAEISHSTDITPQGRRQLAAQIIEYNRR